MRQRKESIFSTHDGEELFYRYWPASSEKSSGAIILFHRGHEHGERMAHLVDELDLPEFSFFAWDARGHGKSPGPRGYSPGIDYSVRDIQTFFEHIQNSFNFKQEDIAVIAQSVGAVLASTWIHDYAPKIRCAVIASPAFKVKLYVPFARTAISLMQKLKGYFYVNSYVKAKFLTHDKERIDSYNKDPLIARPISSKILLELYEVSERIIKDAHAITVPIQLLISGADWVVHQTPQHDFFNELGSIRKERHVLDGFYHDTLGEKDRHIALEKARSFLLEQFGGEVQLPDLRKEHLRGLSRREADNLSSPLPTFSFKGMYWSMMRFGMKIGALLSRGVKIGEDTGYDSGSTLDYVYQNSPRGLGSLGRLVDKMYINSIGWKGIRKRKEHIEELIDVVFEKLKSAGMETRVLDIAAGHGRYLLEEISKMNEKPDSVLLRDYSDINVECGNQLIQELKLQDIATFIKADAFDADSISNTTPKPTLGVISGLFELFSDNELLERSLSGMGNAIQENGYLIYTNQPWHPQLELIARALTSHRQSQAWVMRRRSQVEMDQLVEAAGFTKITQRIDKWGIFTVTLAQNI